MPFFGRRQRRDEAVPRPLGDDQSEPSGDQSAERELSAQGLEAGGVSVLLPSGAEARGTVRSAGSVRVEGQLLEGTIESDCTVTVGGDARVEGSIRSESVFILGAVRGNITARNRITLENTAVVKGDLCTPGILIEEGAKLEGGIQIG